MLSVALSLLILLCWTSIMCSMRCCRVVDVAMIAIISRTMIFPLSLNANVAAVGGILRIVVL